MPTSQPLSYAVKEEEDGSITISFYHHRSKDVIGSGYSLPSEYSISINRDSAYAFSRDLSNVLARTVGNNRKAAIAASREKRSND